MQRYDKTCNFERKDVLKKVINYFDILLEKRHFRLLPAFCNIKNKGIGTGETCPTPNLCEFWAFLQLTEDVEDTFFVISDSSEKGHF